MKSIIRSLFGRSFFLQFLALVIIIIYVSLFILPVLWNTRHLVFNKSTDYDAGIPVWTTVAKQFVETGNLPKWNYFVSTGIPVVWDPNSIVLNPVFFVPLLLSPDETGLRAVIFLSVIFSGILFYLSSRGLSDHIPIRIWGSLLYATSGPVVGKIASGHINTLICYVFLPIIIRTALSKYLSPKIVLASSLSLALMVFAGDLYMPFFALVLFGISRIYWILQGVSFFRVAMQGSALILLFTAMISVKMVPFLLHISDKMTRYFPIDTYAGSLHLVLYPLPFILPFASEFYDRPSVQKLMGFYYNWHEYYAYISPFPFALMVIAKKAWSDSRVKLLILLLATGAFYVANKHWYSPFHWLFELMPLLQSYRVPQRMYLPMVSVTILLFIILFQKFFIFEKKKTGMVIGLVSLAAVFFQNQQLLYQAFVGERIEDRKLMRALRESDQSQFYVISFVCCMQTYLVKEGIPVLNYYYGWRPVETPNFLTAKGNHFDYSQLFNHRSHYVISVKGADLSNYSYYEYLKSSDRIVWKTDYPNYIPLCRHE